MKDPQIRELTSPQRLNRLQILDRDDLIEMLREDANAIVRHEAAFLLGDRHAEDPKVLEMLCRAVSDASKIVRHEVALALANFPGEQAIHFLVMLAGDTDGDVRSSAEYALTEMGEAAAHVLGVSAARTLRSAGA